MFITWLEFCLKNTYFLFQGKYYEQAHGAAMGPPISPIVAHLLMEDFDNKAINTAINPRKIWKRYADTFVIQKTKHTTPFLQHINSTDPPTSLYRTPMQMGIYTLFGQPYYTLTWKHITHRCLQETYPHRPVCSLTQPLQPFCFVCFYVTNMVSI